MGSPALAGLGWLGWLGWTGLAWNWNWNWDRIAIATGCTGALPEFHFWLEFWEGACVGEVFNRSIVSVCGVCVGFYDIWGWLAFANAWLTGAANCFLVCRWEGGFFFKCCC